MDKFFEKLSLNTILTRMIPSVVMLVLILLDLIFLNCFSTDKINIIELISNMGSINLLFVMLCIGSIYFVIHRYFVGESLIYRLQLLLSSFIDKDNDKKLHSDSEYFIGLGFKNRDIRQIYITYRSVLKSKSLQDKIYRIHYSYSKIDDININISDIEYNHTNLHLAFITAELLLFNSIVLKLLLFPALFQIIFIVLSILFFIASFSSDIKQHTQEIRFFNSMLSKDDFFYLLEENNQASINAHENKVYYLILSELLKYDYNNILFRYNHKHNKLEFRNKKNDVNSIVDTDYYNKFISDECKYRNNSFIKYITVTVVIIVLLGIFFIIDNQCISYILHYLLPL